MAILHHVDVDDWAVYVTGHGTITPADVTAFIDAARRDPSIAPNMHWLVDTRPALVELSADDVRELGRTYSSYGVDPTLRVTVVTSTVTAAVLARMFAGHAAFPAERFSVFRDLNDARVWLGLGSVPA